MTEELEDKIKRLLQYSFSDDGVFIDYMWLTDEESEILTEEDYKELLKYITS